MAAALAQDDQLAQFLELANKVYSRSYLAITESYADRHILNRSWERLGSTSRLLVDIGDRLDPTVLHELLTHIHVLQTRLQSLIEDTMDSTVNGYVCGVTNSTPSARGGRPKKVIDLDVLRQAVHLRLGPSYIANMLTSTSKTSVSRWTVRNRIVQAGLAVPRTTHLAKTTISEEDLQFWAEEWILRQPEVGIDFLKAGLHTDGIFVTLARVKAVYKYLRPLRDALNTKAKPTRDVYKCAGPNAVWHHDGQHRLILFGIVIHAFVDGFSRTITCIRASTNNRASTVFDVFRDGIETYGTPSRVRGDRGGENVDVARHMLAYRGHGRGSYMWGV